MKHTRLLLSAALLVVWVGCSTSREPAASEGTTAPADASSTVGFTRAQVYVDGEDRGTTPKTVQVRRGFGESVISLHVGKNVVRTFEIERARTSNRSELDLTPRTSRRSTFDVTDLNTRRDGVYLIPYFAGPVEIEDREYGLTLIVEH